LYHATSKRLEESKKMPTQQSTTQARSPKNVKAAPGGGKDAVMPERDEVYGLVSVIYHALQDAETYAQYARDAESASDDELVEFFRECGAEETTRAERAKELLAARIADDEASEEDDDEED